MAITTLENPNTEAAKQPAFVGDRKKVAAHLTLNEPLLFEKSSPGKRAYRAMKAGASRTFKASSN